MKDVLIISHADCADGLTACWVVKKRYPEADVLFARYDDTPPPLESLTDKHVIIVDFSYSPEVLVEMTDRAAMVVVLDHHKTAIEAIQRYFITHTAPDNLVLKLDLEQSGAGLAWRHFFYNTPEPWLVKYVEDRDLWRFQYPETKTVMAGVFAYPLTLEAWDKLAETSPTEIMRLGESMLSKESKDIGWHLGHAVNVVTFEGYTVPCLNIPKYLTSEACSHLMESYPFVMAYYDDNGKRCFSLRSHRDGVDVSEIAKRYGGGGHRNAAGFVQKSPTFIRVPWYRSLWLNIRLIIDVWLDTLLDKRQQYLQSNSKEESDQ